jgi:thiamine-phosphate pyrophosphorylase
MLDPFYLIVDDADWLGRLLPLGVRLAQLRIKDGSPAELRRQVRVARTLCARFEALLVVNDHWQLAIEEGCGFVHLGQEDADSADIDAIRKAGIRLGISTHDDDELNRALSLMPDYVALGPIYPTVLKQMSWAPQGLERLATWKARLGALPLVAIGGLTPERGRAVLAAGADVAAVSSDVLRHPDPEARVREWLAATRRREA